MATNIGVHFFDLLIWLFGKVQNYEVNLSNEDKMRGTLELENASINWFLSLDRNDLPKEAIDKKRSTYRSIMIDNEEIEFTEGFTDLHTEVYKATLNGNGFTINDARQSIELVEKLRKTV